MPIFTDPPPLSLYIHLPWCVQKCPYCDFNSHQLRDTLPEQHYVCALLEEIDSRLHLIGNRPIISVFFGGGTPSLFSAAAIEQIIAGASARLRFVSNVEITLEANPGTIDQANFKDFHQAGINRLSLGVQSLQDEKLKILGRIHNSHHATKAIEIAKDAGFTNLNIDLMYGLPDQSIEDVLHDIRKALSYDPTHFSWYQLTIEPNTLFYHDTPSLPPDDAIWEMQLAGQALINEAGLHQYEVSAYAKPHRECRHNLNYWEFGDYLGIGAGAHSKITDTINNQVIRFSQIKHPRNYLDPAKRQLIETKILTEKDLIFEFMLNALRLTNGVPANLFTERTGLPMSSISDKLTKAKESGLLLDTPERICPSELGKKFLNDLIEMFLD